MVKKLVRWKGRLRFMEERQLYWYRENKSAGERDREADSSDGVLILKSFSFIELH